MTTLDLSRDYWNAQPCNARHSPEPVGSAAYHVEVSSRKYFVEPHIPLFAEFERWTGKRVLDVGCGIGTMALSFGEYQARVVAVDFSSRSLDVARARLPVSFGGGNVTFLEADANELYWAFEKLDRHHITRLREPYDLIWSFGVLHHLSDPVAALCSFRLLAKSTTILRLMVYRRWSLKGLAVWLKLAQPEAAAGCPQVQLYSRRSLNKLLRAANWELVSARAAHIFPYDWREYRRYRYVKLWWVRLLPARWFAALERLLGWHLLIEARPR